MVFVEGDVEVDARDMESNMRNDDIVFFLAKMSSG